jgi:hypothetical protein
MCVSHALAGPMGCSAVAATVGFSIINYRNTYHHTQAVRTPNRAAVTVRETDNRSYLEHGSSGAFIYVRKTR